MDDGSSSRHQQVDSSRRFISSFRFEPLPITCPAVCAGRPVDDSPASGHINEAKFFLSQYRAAVFDDHFNTAAEATVIQPTSLTDGELETASDHDFFRFTKVQHVKAARPMAPSPSQTGPAVRRLEQELTPRTAKFSIPGESISPSIPLYSPEIPGVSAGPATRSTAQQ